MVFYKRKLRKIKDAIDQFLQINVTLEEQAEPTVLLEERSICEDAAPMAECQPMQSAKQMDFSSAMPLPQKMSPAFSRPLAKRSLQRSLDDVVKELDESFSEMLLRIIDEKGMKDSAVYKRANIDRRLFSKIRGDAEYVPSKKTVLAFAFALKLSLDETKDLLGRAGYALSTASRFDAIITWLIDNKEYDINFVNIVLDEYGEGTLSR